jgi:hypothetical protein
MLRVGLHRNNFDYYLFLAALLTFVSLIRFNWGCLDIPDKQEVDQLNHSQWRNRTSTP